MTDHLAFLRADVDAVADVLGRASMTEPVVACPGWTLRDLIEHLGNTHRWATRILQTGALQPEPTGSPPDLRAWFVEGAAELLSTMAAVDPAGPCWSFTTDKTNGFWVRRQSLETVVHRWDAQGAIGEPGLIAPALAADGVGEVVDLIAPRQVKRGRIPVPASIALEAIDTGDRWVLGAGDVTGSVTSTAEVLLLLLWHRIDPADPRVQVQGSAAEVLRLPLAP